MFDVSSLVSCCFDPIHIFRLKICRLPHSKAVHSYSETCQRFLFSARGRTLAPGRFYLQRQVEICFVFTVEGFLSMTFRVEV